jgi:pimeloyl-ACP methyl ester carboxylesterase
MRFVLDSGRRVAVHLTSTRGLRPAADRERLVVFCHGAPGAGSFDPDPAETLARKVTLLSVDRPGYGRSDPVGAGEWATVHSAADDIATVLDALHVDEPVGVAGWSAGGRVALALAARRPDLVDRVVVIATPAPDDEVPWIDPTHRAELEQLRALGAADARAALEHSIDSRVPADVSSDGALWLFAAEPVSEPALRDRDVRSRLGEMLRAAFAQGAVGMAADLAGYCLQPWGFEPDAVEAKTLLLYGSQDPIAAPRHGRWWQAQLPDARLEVAHGEGHLLVVPMWSRALEHLVPDPPRLRVLAGARSSEGDSDFEVFPAA